MFTIAFPIHVCTALRLQYNERITNTVRCVIVSHGRIHMPLSNIGGNPQKLDDYSEVHLCSKDHKERCASRWQALSIPKLTSGILSAHSCSHLELGNTFQKQFWDNV